MNQCCWRWRFGASSLNKQGQVSTLYDRDTITHCPQCGEVLDDDAIEDKKELQDLKNEADQLNARIRNLERKMEGEGHG